MGAAEQNTFKIAAVDGGARRPSTDDMGIGVVSENGIPKAIVDVPPLPPQNGKWLYGNLVNQAVFQAHAAARQVKSAKLTIKYSAGAPFIFACECANDDIIPASFDTPEDLGPGQLAISWDSTLLPPVVTWPTTTVHATAAGGALSEAASALPRMDPAPPTGKTRVIIDCYVGAVATDLIFTIEI